MVGIDEQQGTEQSCSKQALKVSDSSKCTAGQGLGVLEGHLILLTCSI